MAISIQLNLLKKIDCFAQPIYLNFKGKTHYKTYIGATVSLICISVVAIIFAIKTVDLVSKVGDEKTMIEAESKYELLDLYKLGFMFAIEKIDPRRGKVTMTAESSSVNGNETAENIPMVDCYKLFNQ